MDWFLYNRDLSHERAKFAFEKNDTFSGRTYVWFKFPENL